VVSTRRDGALAAAVIAGVTWRRSPVTIVAKWACAASTPTARSAAPVTTARSAVVPPGGIPDAARQLGCERRRGRCAGADRQTPSRRTARSCPARTARARSDLQDPRGSR
jgi:hypothetical protein